MTRDFASFTREECEHVARATWGAHAFVSERRRYTGKETADPDGWIRPAGEVYSYAIGYKRRGKRGGFYLSTVKGEGPTLGEMLAAALTEMATTKAFVKFCAAISALQSTERA